MTYQTINPYTNEVVTTFPNATKEEVDNAISAAHEAFHAWRDTPFEVRTTVLAKAAELLRADKRRYAELLTLEMGKVIAEAEAEVDLSADILQYYADHGASLLETVKVPVALAAEGEVEIVSEPLGVILTVEPWNFPYYQVVRVAAPQLLAGNTILLKHASNVPQAAAAFDDLFERAGLPAGAFKNLYLPHNLTEYVIDDPRIRGGRPSPAAKRPERSSPDTRRRRSRRARSSSAALMPSSFWETQTSTRPWSGPFFGRHWKRRSGCACRRSG